MSTPIDREKRLCQMFDSYCKSVLENTSKYLWRKAGLHSQREEIVDIAVIADLLPQRDNYPSHRFIIFADELSCEVENEFVYNAFMLMTDKERKVLILDFWKGWKDKQISEYLGVTVRTVYNLRQRAYKTIRRLYDQKGLRF